MRIYSSKSSSNPTDTRQYRTDQNKKQKLNEWISTDIITKKKSPVFVEQKTNQEEYNIEHKYKQNSKFLNGLEEMLCEWEKER